MGRLLGPSAFKPRRANASRPAWKVADAFRARLRKLPCACGGRNPDCGGPMRSAHVDYAAKGTPDAKGMSSKVADRCCIPLSDNCHRLQHNIGWPTFERTYLPGGNIPNKAERLSEEYWGNWDGRGKWEAAHA